MDDAVAVRIRERVGQIGEQRPRRVRFDPPLQAQSRRERLAGDVAHDEVHETVDLAKREERHDVRMIEARRRSRFAPEAFAEVRRSGVLGREHLDGHVAIERELVRQIDRAHAAASEQPFDAVLEADCAFEGVPQRIGRGVLRRLDARATLEAEAGFIGEGGAALAAFHAISSQEMRR